MVLVISIVVAVWVFSDALNKNIKYSWLWALGALVFIFIGLPIYIARRQLKPEEKLLKKIIKPICVGLTAFVMLVLIFYNYKERNSYRCNTCFAKKDAFQWRLGQWGSNDSSIPLSSKWENISETNFLKDFIGETLHQHDWNHAQGSPYYFFGLGGFRGCAIGDGRHISYLSKKYEENERFRAFIQKKLLAGILTKQKFIDMYSFKPFDGKSPLEKEGNDLYFEFDEDEWIKGESANIAK
jgi:amino acid transporter